MDWLLHYGLKQENLVYRDHEKDELSHYSAGTVDIEYIYPFGQSELWGIANRTDYDLSAHQNASGEKLEYHDPETNEKYIPYVIEPSLGLNRAFLAFICDSYTEDAERGIVLKIHNDLAPYKMCVLPLQNKQKDKAQEVYKMLSKHYMIDFDSSGNIGKRYKRQDAIGTPYCITVDFDTMEDNTVTIRDRDTTEQVRVKIEDLVAYFQDKFNL